MAKNQLYNPPKLGEAIAHGDLNDMPDTGGTNTDHDARYYTESEVASLFLKLDQSTPQTITASPIFDFGVSTQLAYFDALKKLTSSAKLTFDGTKISNLGYIKFDTTDNNTFIGNGAGNNVVTGAVSNTFVGGRAGYSTFGSATDAADENSAFGLYSLYNLTTGNNNSAFGVEALYYNTSGATNTGIGSYALFTNSTGSGNVALGYFAGKYEAGSNAFYVDNQDRTNTAGDKAKALLYGTFNTTAATQTLAINGVLSNLPDTDAIATFGRAKIGQVTPGLSDYAGISHYDMASDVGYALIQHTGGDIYLNSPTGALTSIRKNNVDAATLSDTLWTHLTPTLINTNSTTALKVEQTGVKNNVLVVDTTNGLVGIGKTPSAGVALDVNGNIAVTTGIDMNNSNITEIKTATFTSEIDDGNSGAAGKTIDWSTGSKHKLTVNGAATITFTDPVGPTNLILKLVNGGSAVFTWTAGDEPKWAGGTDPSWTAAGTDILALYFDGTTYYGSAILDAK